jgi:predicted  nucleic acid-binding Zn-ribbon protein
MVNIDELNSEQIDEKIEEMKEKIDEMDRPLPDEVLDKIETLMYAKMFVGLDELSQVGEETNDRT